MMWGMTLHPGVEYTREITRQEYMTLVALDCRPQMNRGETNLTAHLVLKCDGYEHVLCTLQQGLIHQQILNFILFEGENMTLAVEGTGTVHVTGYSKEHPYLSDGMTGTTETTVKREVHDGIQDGGGHSSHPSFGGDQSITIDEDSVIEVKCESQHRCDLESTETAEGSYQQLNDDNNIMTDSVAGDDIHNSDTGNDSVTRDGIHNSGTGNDIVTGDGIYDSDTVSRPGETLNVNLDRNDIESNVKSTVSTGSNLEEDTHNFTSHVKTENDQAKEQHFNRRNAIFTNEEMDGAVGSHENTIEVPEPSSTFVDRENHRQSIGVTALSFDNVLEHPSNCMSQDNAETEQGSDQHLNNSNAFSTSNEVESVSDSNESTHATMESSAMEMDRNDHCQSPDEVECAFMDQTSSVETVIEGSNGNIIQTTMDHQNEEGTQSSCPLNEKNVGNEVPLEAIEIGSIQLDRSLHQAHWKTKRCAVVLKRINKSYGNHPHSHLGERSFICQVCGETFNEKIALAIHKQNHTVKQALTSQCKLNKLKHKKVFKLQGKRHTDRQLFKCKYCDKKFCHKAKLQNHQSSIHTGERPFKCQHCEKKFHYRYRLRRHELIHTGEKPFTCEDCGKKFKCKEGLKQHKIMHTSYEPFRCKHCGKQLRAKVNLILHERIHTGEKPFKCEYCNKMFRWKSNLIVHERFHTGEKQPVRCEHCDKMFISKAHLTRHKRIHTGQKPFKCEHCGKNFNQKGNLMKHKRSHSNLRPFKCEQCDKKFKEKAHLKCHEILHTRKKPSRCESCDKQLM